MSALVLFGIALCAICAVCAVIWGLVLVLGLCSLWCGLCRVWGWVWGRA